MNTYIVKPPATLSGTIQLPTSKSISNRLLLLSALCGSQSRPSDLSDSDDTAVMLKALDSDLSHVDVGAAGTSMRFLTAYLATVSGRHEITGSARMLQRPIGLLVEALRELGAKVDYLGHEGFPPLAIEGGHIAGGHLTLPGNVSSQYISALMMIGPTLQGGLSITLEGEIISTPYILMTMRLMRLFGAEVSWSSGVIAVREGGYTYKQMSVEGDWSAASYWYAMVALQPGSSVQLLGLDEDSAQGDSAVVRIAEPLGVSTTYNNKGVLITSSGNLPKHFDYDFVNQPDLAQTFAVLCCLLGVPYKLSGLRSLRIKETDRLAALENELRKIGYVVRAHQEPNGDETLVWDGTTCHATEGKPIETYKDHRMAMAFAPAALRHKVVSIADPAVVSKSYPKFWDHLRSVGFSIEEC